LDFRQLYPYRCITIKENNGKYELIENPDADTIETDLKPAIEETSLNQILISLISDKNNISLKTELHNPKALAVLKMLADYFESKDYTITAGVINGFITTYMEYMVSHKRKSRAEIVKALSSWIEREERNKQNSTNLMIGKTE
jgi:hypothetical protein